MRSLTNFSKAQNRGQDRFRLVLQVQKFRGDNYARADARTFRDNR